VRVETEHGSYHAERLVIAPGPWAAELLGCSGGAGHDGGGDDACIGPTIGGIDPAWFTVQRMVNVHFEPTRAELFGPERCPVYILEVPEGVHYGFPALPEQGIKFGRHDLGEVCTPRTIRREVDPAEVEALRAVLERYLPGAAGPVKWTLTCMYTNTPDRDFILDRHPAHAQVVFGAGFSGHGFKFAGVIGEVLAELALDGGTGHEIGFLSAARFRAA
jgi:sarcosine oxidase